MPTPPVPLADIRSTVAMWSAILKEGFDPVSRQGVVGSALAELARRLGFRAGSNAAKRLDTAAALGLMVPHWRQVEGEWAERQRLRYAAMDEEYRGGGATTAPLRSAAQPIPDREAQPGRGPPPRAPAAPPDRGSPPAEPVVATPEQMIEKIVGILRRGPRAAEEIAAQLGVHWLTVEKLVHQARAAGAAVEFRGDRWHLDTAPPLGSQHDHRRSIFSDDEGIIRIAACGDMHLCSKYERLDCLNDYYDQVAARGIGVVLNTGNWIDGEAEFNKHDLLVHGMDAQMRYLAAHYPQRQGVQTWAITGADHEGWYARREGVDVGRYAARVMEDAGRSDWRDMGYMECFIPLVHKATGKSTRLCLMHPGGGSAYALSYAPQKIVEGFDGGDKPAVLLIGHYHKSGYNLIRNVHTAQTGTFQDQTVFMRQKKLAAHLGGCFLELRLDPETGAVIECSYSFRNYFVREYYNGRWSQHGDVKHAPRSSRAV